jgi:hypothetical protein
VAAGGGGAVVTVLVPIRTVSEANARGHWAVRAKRVKGQRQAVAVALIATGRRGPMLALFAPLCITLTRVAPRMLDDDNNAGALKATRDAVADWLGIDDGDTARLRFVTAQRKGKAGEYAVEIAIEAAQEAG